MLYCAIKWTVNVNKAMSPWVWCVWNWINMGWDVNTYFLNLRLCLPLQSNRGAKRESGNKFGERVLLNGLWHILYLKLDIFIQFGVFSFKRLLYSFWYFFCFRQLSLLPLFKWYAKPVNQFLMATLLQTSTNTSSPQSPSNVTRIFL